MFNVSAIITTFKRNKEFSKALNSVYLQTYKPQEIIIVNNDNKFFYNIKNNKKKITIVNCIKNFNSANGRNLGASLAKGNFLAFLDDDDLWDKNYLKDAYTIYKNVKAPATYRENEKEFKEYGYFKEDKKKKLSKNNILEVNWVTGNIFLIRKKDLNTIGYYDENIFLQYDDIDYCKRIFDKKRKVIINFNAKSKHLEGKSHDPKLSFEMKSESSWHTSWSCYYFYKKHYGHLYALRKNILIIIKYFLSYFFYYLINNKEKKEIYSLLLSGFYYSIIGKKSFYRAKF